MVLADSPSFGPTTTDKMHVMGQVDVIRSLDSLRQIEPDWQRLRQMTAGLSIDFGEYFDLLVEGQGEVSPCVILVRSGEEVRLIAPFVQTTAQKKFSLGLPKEVCLPVSILWLEGESFLGSLSASDVEAILAAAGMISGVDLVRLGAIPKQSEFHQVITSRLPGMSLTAPPALREKWVVDLPDSFVQYLETLSSSKLRYNVRRMIRRFADLRKGTLQCITAPADVRSFLDSAESVSRLTYQWKIGHGICADAETIRACSRHARHGLMRCYLLMSESGPCAFVQGVVRGTVYEFLKTGFSPSAAADSPGTVLLMEVIRDLIENTGCQVLDFGYAGWDYKVRFGTRVYETDYLEFCRKGFNYGRLLLAADRILSSAKSCLRRFRRRTSAD
jgi:Acetyltransferase (GNAT) domain